MNKQKKKISLIVGTIGIILIGYFGYQFLSYVGTDNAQVEAPTVMLAAKVGGFLIKTNAIEGQKVKKGDVLIEIDNRDYKTVYESAESELQSLEVRRKEAEKSYGRLKALHSENVVSSQQYDSSLANYNDVKAKYDSAFAKLTQTKLNLENTQIKAPSDGIIAKTSAEIGQLAAIGVPLVGFIGSNSRWINANFKETEIKDIKIGNQVDIKIDALPHKKYKGEVESISPSTGATFTLLPPDNATGNFTKVVQRVPVRIKFTDISAEEFESIRAGLSAEVKVHIR